MTTPDEPRRITRTLVVVREDATGRLKLIGHARTREQVARVFSLHRNTPIEWCPVTLTLPGKAPLVTEAWRIGR